MWKQKKLLRLSDMQGHDEHEFIAKGKIDHSAQEQFYCMNKKNRKN